MELEISDYGMNGEGVAFDNNKTVFVPHSIVGESVCVLVEKDFGNYALSKIDKIVEKSSMRVCPPCPYFYECGGCNLQHMNYSEQLKFKSLLVKKTLKKIAGIDSIVMNTIPCETQYNYRNKVSFNIENGKIGFFKENSKEIVEIEKCLLTSTNINKILDLFRSFYYQQNDNTKSLFKHLVIREISNQILVGVVTKAKINLSALYNLLSSHLSNIGLYLIINKRKDSVVLSGQIVHISGIKKIEIENFGIKYSVDLVGFHQTNIEIQNKIYQKILEYICPNDRVINAYSGAGLLSAVVSKKAKKVIGIEIVFNSHQSANILKQRNEISNLTNILGSVDKEITKFDKLPDIIILDPSKKGCGKQVMESIIGVNNIIYMSCNPIALAKDLRYIINDYQIEEITPFDMFPNTKNIETVVKLKKIGEKL